MGVVEGRTNEHEHFRNSLTIVVKTKKGEGGLFLGDLPGSLHLNHPVPRMAEKPKVLA